MAHIRDLNPKLRNDELIFLCPACRKHEIRVHVRRSPAGEADGIRYWQMTGSFFDMDITVTPSIGTENLVGRARNCGWHGFITNGEVTP